MESGKRWYRKDKKKNKTMWVEDENAGFGKMLFTFDKKKIYNLFADYPEKLPVKEWIVFTSENPYWADFFADRNMMYAAENIDEIKRLGRLDLVK